jgi:hypothetical protein
MSVYHPDVWVVLEFDYKGDVIRKILAGWYGGYANGDSWKLSSGITKTNEFEDRYEFENHSGSLYVCPKLAERMSGYTGQMYQKFLNEVKDMENVTMKLIEYTSQKEQNETYIKLQARQTN